MLVLAGLRDSHYPLLVTAKDTVVDRRTTILEIEILVKDVQDQIIVFSKHLYEVSISENQVNHLVFIIKVGPSASLHQWTFLEHTYITQHKSYQLKCQKVHRFVCEGQILFIYSFPGFFWQILHVRDPNKN